LYNIKIGPTKSSYTASVRMLLDIGSKPWIKLYIN